MKVSKKDILKWLDIGFTHKEIAKACNLSSPVCIFRVLNGIHTNVRVEHKVAKKGLLGVLKEKRERLTEMRRKL